MTGSVDSHVPADASVSKPLSGRVSLFLRLWSYGGPSQPPTCLHLEQDQAIAELLNSVVNDGKGSISDRTGELIEARFSDALQALATAKSLQQRFLTFHRRIEPQQAVPSILIYPADCVPDPDPEAPAPQDMLANITSAQILIAGSIYESVKGVPGFKFNPTPVREAGQTFGREAIYELLWTDESTYGHLRQASRAGLKTVGRYQIQEELGRGAMGAVYKAYDELIGRTVALKMIPIKEDTPERDQLIERLKQEAKAAGGLDHPNIITIYDVGEENDHVYLTMQYVKGITLATLLAEVGVPSLPTFISWTDQICDGVGFAHSRGVVHRDLKPANLMVTDQGVIKILDFGIAKIENTSLTQTGLVVGTPSYMSPEQVLGNKVDHRADIFSLGSVFYELVTSDKAFRGDVTTVLYKIVHEDPVAPSLINPAVPGGIDSVIRKALAKDPRERFQKCEEMKNAFLEQASRLNISLVAPAPAIPVSKRRSEAHATPAPSFASIEEPRGNWGIKFVFLALLIGLAISGYYYRFRSDTVSAAARSAIALAQRVSARVPELRSSDAGDRPLSPTDHETRSASAQPSPALTVSTPVAHDGQGVSNAPGSSNPVQSTAMKPPQSADGSPHDAALVPVITMPHPETQETPQPQAAYSEVQSLAQSEGDASSIAIESDAADGIGNTKSSTSNDSQGPSEGEKSKPEGPLVVDGFTRHDVPDLLRQAEVAEQKGDVRLAGYEYNLVLKLDRSNTKARQALRRLRSLVSR